MIDFDLLEQHNATELVLDPKHPGIHDAHYCDRRRYFFNHSRRERLNHSVAAYVEYTEEEQALWRLISNKLVAPHEQWANQLYLDGKHELSITTTKIPQQAEINEVLSRLTDVRIVPAEGLLTTQSFFYYLTQHRMPCTQFVRHPGEPQYTPEPDMVHDMIGHVPALIHPEYAEITYLIGQGVMSAKTEEELRAWERLYWFTVEFSLIQEKGEIKIFGAGHLSSFGEMAYVMSDQVTRKPFDIETVIQTDYDNTRMQDIVFIIPSLRELKEALQNLQA